MHIQKTLPLALLAACASLTAATAQTPLEIDRLQGPGSIFAPAGPTCTGGVKMDDGTFETGYVLNFTSSAQIVQRLTPATYPSLLTRACLCWVSGDPAATLLPYNLMVYDDNGPGGQPGTLLGTRAVTANSVSSTAYTFFGYDCSLLDVGVSSGSVYIGANWNPIANPNFFLCADESLTTPRAKVYGSANGGTNWTAFEDVDASSRAVGVRAEFFANGCIPDDFTLCLLNGRFSVQATFQTEGGATTPAHVAKLTDQTGYLWFFDEANVEAVIKVIDGCSFNDRYWVFAGGLTNVRTVITVTDKQESNTKVYINPQSTPFKPLQDTTAFATCGG